MGTWLVREEELCERIGPLGMAPGPWLTNKARKEVRIKCKY